MSELYTFPLIDDPSEYKNSSVIPPFDSNQSDELYYFDKRYAFPSTYSKEGEKSISIVSQDTKQSHNQTITIPINRFKVIKEDKTENIYLNKKRKQKGGIEGIETRKYAEDNILLKIEVDFHNFIPKYLNYLLKVFSYKKKNKFYKLSAKLKKNITKKLHGEVLNKKIKDILIQNISGKYKKYSSNHNETLYKDVIKEIPLMNKILDMNYLTLFQTVYFPSKREINLKNICDIEKTIYLPKSVKLFKDKFDKFKETTYVKKIYYVVNENYFNGKISFFSFNENN